MKRPDHLVSFRISPKPKPHSGLLQFISKFKLLISFFYFLRIPIVFLFYFCLFTFYLNTFDVFSQQPTEEWVARYTGPSNDLNGPFLAVDKQGNSYIAGTHVINDSINILCAKYNTNGVQQWAALYKYPGYGYFTPSGLALDTLGNAYVTSGYALNTFVPQNILLVKFSVSNGSVVWAKNYTGQYSSSGYDIKIDKSNNIYLAGYSDSSYLLIKYNTGGDSVWVRKSFLYAVRDISYACTIDDSLNIILTGSRSSCLPPPQQGCPFDTVLTAKYSPGGELRWLRTYRYGSDLVHSGRKITNDQNGNIYIGGVTRVSGYGVFLTIKYDRNGVLQWGKIYDAPGNGENYFSNIVIDRINNSLYSTGITYVSSLGASTTIKYIVSTGDSSWVRRGIGTAYSSGSWDINIDRFGSTYITGGISPTNTSTSDFMTLKYSTNGNQVWLATYNGPFSGIDGGRIIKLDTSNNIYVLGYSQNSPSISDYVLIKYSQLLVIQSINTVAPSFFVLEQNYPNPFNPSTKIRLSVPKLSFIQLRIYDILGRTIEIPVNEQLSPAVYELKVDASSYASGVYFYQLKADGNIIGTKKFVVLK